MRVLCFSATATAVNRRTAAARQGVVTKKTDQCIKRRDRKAVTLYVGTMNTIRTIWLCCRGSTKFDRCSTICRFTKDIGGRSLGLVHTTTKHINTKNIKRVLSRDQGSGEIMLRVPAVQ